MVKTIKNKSISMLAKLAATVLGLFVASVASDAMAQAPAPQALKDKIAEAKANMEAIKADQLAVSTSMSCLKSKASNEGDTSLLGSFNVSKGSVSENFSARSCGNSTTAIDLKAMQGQCTSLAAECKKDGVEVKFTARRTTAAR